MSSSKRKEGRHKISGIVMVFVTLGLGGTLGRFNPTLHFRGKKTEAQRGEVTCSKSHSNIVLEGHEQANFS